MLNAFVPLQITTEKSESGENVVLYRLVFTFNCENDAQN